MVEDHYDSCEIVIQKRTVEVCIEKKLYTRHQVALHQSSYDNITVRDLRRFSAAGLFGTVVPS